MSTVGSGVTACVLAIHGAILSVAAGVGKPPGLLVRDAFAGRQTFSVPALAQVGELARIYGLDSPAADSGPEGDRTDAL
ncbi:MAG TPA: hypothetical protein VHB47_22805 [Thermoanaerobaculia bacterium]|jgi:hypothetical protein|nr:hypothetical protein [Thermoanaerobaculia bacterium]